jgi:hypothetical protein
MDWLWLILYALGGVIGFLCDHGGSDSDPRAGMARRLKMPGGETILPAADARAASRGGWRITVGRR